MAMKTLILENLRQLCDCTYPNDTLLNGLVMFEIIPKGMRAKLKVETDDETKNMVLYEFLKNSRTDKDLEKVMELLKTSANSAAYEIFKNAQATGRQNIAKPWKREDPISIPSSFRYQYEGVVHDYVPRKHLQMDVFLHLNSTCSKETKITFQLVVLYGFGGNGKTQMARKIVQTCGIDDFIWITASTEKSILDGFKGFVNMQAEVLECDFSYFVKNIYVGLRDKKFLLVLDDVDDFEMLQKYLPMNNLDTNVRIIITSHKEWPSRDKAIRNIQVGNFPVKEFKTFVEQTLHSTVSEGDLKLLAEYTGRIPANVSLVCKGIRECLEYSASYKISTHLEKYGEKIFKFGIDGCMIPGYEDFDYKKSTVVVVEQQVACMKSFGRQDIAQLATEILYRLAYCDHEGISEEYFLLKHLGLHLKLAQNSVGGDHYAIEMKQAVGFLEKYGWIHMCPDREASARYPIFSIHACYQIGLRTLLQRLETEKDILRGMIEYVQVQVVENDYNRDALFEEQRRHVRTFWTFVKNYASLLKLACSSNHCLLALACNDMITDVENLACEFKQLNTKANLVVALLNDRIENSSEFQFSRSVLYWLCWHGQTDVVEKFIEPINEGFHDNPTNMAWVRHQLIKAAAGAICGGEIKPLRLLVFGSIKLDLNQALDSVIGLTLVHVAANCGNLEILNLLIKCKAELDISNGYGDTPLLIAVLHSRLEIVKVLIENKVNLDAKDKNGNTPLLIAVLHSTLEIVKVLIENKGNLNARDNNDNTPLHIAVLQSRLEIVKILIENKSNLEAKDKNGNTPLHIAVLQGKFEIVKVLIENKSNLEAKDKNGNTPLHIAVLHSKLEIVKVLIESKANLDAKDKNRNTPLHIAVLQSKLEFVKVLIENKANLDAKDKNGNTPLHIAVLHSKLEIKKANSDANDNYGNTSLHIAVLHSKLEIVKVLIENKANLEERNNDGETPLHIAVLQNKLEIVKVLIENNWEEEDSDSDGDTALHIAVLQNSLDIVKVLIENKANLDAKDNDGNTALHIAVLYGRLEIVKALIENKANLEEKDNDGDTPLRIAVLQNSLDIVMVLIDNKENLEEKDNDGDTPLHIAVLQNKLEIVKDYENKSNLEEEDSDSDGDTPLHIAVLQNSLDIVKVLIDNKANLEEKNNNGNTALHIAVLYGRLEIVKALIDSKANLEEKDNDGDTPLRIGLLQNKLEIVKVLIENKANLKEKDSDGDTALHTAVLQNRLKIVKVLIDNKANLEEKDNDGDTALHIAVLQNSLKIVKVLIDNKANLEEKDNDGDPPLHIAVMQNELEIVKVLIENQANSEERNNEGKTPIHIAVLQSNLEIVKIVVRNTANLD